MSGEWRSVLRLDHERRVVGGAPLDLTRSVQRGADLRIRTDFRYDEHMDTSSPNHELVHEVSDFRVTYLVDTEWVAGVMTLRQPVAGPQQFGPIPSMSFFLYNQDGRQSVARPLLEAPLRQGSQGQYADSPHPTMPKYHLMDSWDIHSNGPSLNFVYEFERYEFYVREDWVEVLSHDENGSVLSGSHKELDEAFRAGLELKVALAGLCDNLGSQDNEHHSEVFVQCGSGYSHSETGLFYAESHPVVRVPPGMPMGYQSRGWDFGWLLAHTNGNVSGLICDPYTLRFSRPTWRCPIRWFVR